MSPQEAVIRNFWLQASCVYFDKGEWAVSIDLCGLGVVPHFVLRQGSYKWLDKMAAEQGAVIVNGLFKASYEKSKKLRACYKNYEDYVSAVTPEWWETSAMWFREEEEAKDFRKFFTEALPFLVSVRVPSRPDNYLKSGLSALAQSQRRKQKVIIAP